MKLPKTLLPPNIPDSISQHAKWLSGEGAGSWFVIEKLDINYRITRYSPKGNIECENVFASNLDFDSTLDFNIDYPSHCLIVNVVQKGKRFRFKEVVSSGV